MPQPISLSDFRTQPDGIQLKKGSTGDLSWIRFLFVRGVTLVSMLTIDAVRTRARISAELPMDLL
jgi:hypothetical protein